MQLRRRCISPTHVIHWPHEAAPCWRRARSRGWVAPGAQSRSDLIHALTLRRQRSGQYSSRSSSSVEHALHCVHTSHHGLRLVRFKLVDAPGSGRCLGEHRLDRGRQNRLVKRARHRVLSCIHSSVSMALHNDQLLLQELWSCCSCSPHPPSSSCQTGSSRDSDQLSNSSRPDSCSRSPRKSWLRCQR